jgi:mono/diheme cytochrome c family protein
MRWIIAGVALTLTLTACESQEATARLSDAEETVAADRQYDAAAYDTVEWASESAAIDRGRDIFLWACADCHGEEGRGDGGRVIDGDTIRPPSFHQEDWPYADDPDGLHRKVFVGNSLGMPHWGLRQMKPRDIVAVERYIRFELIRDDAAPGA